MVYNLRQYESSEPYFGNADSNILNVMDAKRIRAYDLFDGIYNNWPNSLKIVLRGSNSMPIYIPSGKKIVNTTNRFLGKNIDYYVQPNDIYGEPANEAMLKAVEQAMASLYDREQVRFKIANSKKEGLKRGDAVLMITADDRKPVGKRISIHEVDPRTVSVIDGEELGSIAGYYVVEAIRDPREKDKKSTKQICRRQMWRKEVTGEGDSTQTKIRYTETFWTIGKWDDRELDEGDLEKVAHESLIEIDTYLPDQITALPIYRWSSDAPQNSSWGTSILSGLETLCFAINQSISDEDLTLAMRGLGMYVTSAAPPVDPESGEILSWNVGPGQVIEITENQEFTNVAGVDTVSPYIDHMTFADEKGLLESSGTPAVAVGKVDVAVAESGVSLKLQLDPLLAANQDRELAMIVALNQMHFDLASMWLPAYEEIQTDGVVVSVVFEDPMPVNEQQEIQDLTLLWTSDLILTEMAVDKLAKMGWRYPAGMSTDEIVAALEDQAKRKAAAIDPYGAAMAGQPGEENPEETSDTTSIDLGVT